LEGSEVSELDRQSRQILDELTRRSLTPRDAIMLDPPCYRLAARIHDIKRVLGEATIVTVRETHGVGHHARYSLAPGCAIQQSLFA